ncbi:MAG: Zn-ribbon domain-containing OB-fold protein [Deltaproteobacteria bacterium]|nr:Zn-ribbon domain-containing OB-fold protein [Deltaproteobacteria bacterium]
MSRKDYKKPLPRIDEENRWFWEACARHELVLQRCGGCGELRFYPRGLCPACLSSSVEYVRSSGRGRIHTFTVTYQSQAPGFRDELPYVMAYVDLDEGPRVLSNVVHTPPEEVKIGMAVEVVFEDVDEDLAIPRFRRASER